MTNSTTTDKKQALTPRQRAMVIRIDRFVYWLAKHWLAVFNTIAAIYVGLPMLAPVLMNAGWTTPARGIYLAYSPMCHQMASRSFFLFGEQSVYPRELANSSFTPIEAYLADIPEFAGIDPDNWVQFTSAARSFLGNERMGYKMALCERDIGIYLFVLLGGILYAFLRRNPKVKALPLLAFIIIGMGPIGLDGFSQLFGYWFTPADGSAASGVAEFVQNIFPLRESPPWLRTLTGAWFGLCLVWLAYPNIEEGMKQTKTDLEVKLRRVGVLK
jgi:uncharacterized membrane protein